jgi:hypothetical protein
VRDSAFTGKQQQTTGNSHIPHSSPRPGVGPEGASMMSSALHRVAQINNIPIQAPSWCHGSIAKRMNYLRQLCASPGNTARFDRGMSWVYLSLLAALCLSGGWAAMVIWQTG